MSDTEENNTSFQPKNNVEAVQLENPENDSHKYKQNITENDSQYNKNYSDELQHGDDLKQNKSNISQKSQHSLIINNKQIEKSDKIPKQQENEEQINRSQVKSLKFDQENEDIQEQEKEKTPKEATPVSIKPETPKYQKPETPEYKKPDSPITQLKPQTAKPQTPEEQKPQTPKPQTPEEQKPQTPEQIKPQTPPKQEYVLPKPKCHCGFRAVEKIEEQMHLQVELKKKGEAMQKVIDSTSETLGNIDFEDQPTEKIQKTKQHLHLEKELKELNQQYVKYRNQINRLEVQIKSNANHDRINELLDHIHELNLNIKFHSDENKALKQIIEGNNQELMARDQTEELNELRKECDQYKHELRQLNMEKVQEDKKYIVQREYIVRLEKQFRSLCTDNGIPPTLNQEFSQQIAKLTKSNHKRIAAENSDKIQAQKQFEEDKTEKELQKHKKMFEEQKEQKRLETIKQYQEIEKLKGIIKEREGEREQLKKQMATLDSDSQQVMQALSKANKQMTIQDQQKKNMLKRQQTFNIQRLDKPKSTVEYEVYKVPVYKKSEYIAPSTDSRYNDETDMDFGQPKRKARGSTSNSIVFQSPNKRSQRSFTSSKPPSANTSELKLPNIHSTRSANKQLLYESASPAKQRRRGKSIKA